MTHHFQIALVAALVASAIRAHAQHPAPVNRSVPATPCKGGGDCDSGTNLCRPTLRSPSATAVLTFADSGYSVRSDGKGPYRTGIANVRTGADLAAVLLFRPPSDSTAPMRRITVDLTHPVPNRGAVPLGIITDSLWVDMNAQSTTDADFTQHNLLEIPVGVTIDARQFNVGFSIAGIAHALQMGPQPWGHCFSNGTAFFGDGTTMAKITRVDERTFVVDLAPGSIGRLFDVHLHDPHAVDRGLYYVSAHFTIKR